VWGARARSKMRGPPATASAMNEYGRYRGDPNTRTSCNTRLIGGSAKSANGSGRRKESVGPSLRRRVSSRQRQHRRWVHAEIPRRGGPAAQVCRERIRSDSARSKRARLVLPAPPIMISFVKEIFQRFGNTNQSYLSSLRSVMDRCRSGYSHSSVAVERLHTSSGCS
jgi:hypothetical protein